MIVYQKTEVFAILNRKKVNILYDKFRLLLQKNNVTSYRVAADTGISQGTLSDWKHGKTTPKADKLKKIADYFGVTVDYLISNEKAHVK